MTSQPQDEQFGWGNLFEDIESCVSQHCPNNELTVYQNLNFSSNTDIDQTSSLDNLNPNIFEFGQDPFDDFFTDINKNFDETKVEGNVQTTTFYEDPAENWNKQIDEMELVAVDQLIRDRSITIITQPPTDIRRRYESDGKRQIEKSRSKPMSIQLPRLQTGKSNSNFTFWLELCLITTNENPSNSFYIHPDKLEYHAENILLANHGSVRVRLTEDDIKNETKNLARVSIIKKKLDAYTFELVPYNPLSSDTSTTIYENPASKSVVARAKCFRDLYNLTSSCIACQLVIEQNGTWHPTNIVCRTDIMTEKMPNKRQASVDVDDNQQSSAKKRK